MNIFPLTLRAVSYFPPAVHEAIDSLQLPQWPQMVVIERIVVIVLFLILLRPLLWEQADPYLEEKRKRILLYVAILTCVGVVIRIYRVIVGI